MMDWLLPRTGIGLIRRSLRFVQHGIVRRLLRSGEEETFGLIRVTSSIMETKPPVPRAILVGIQVPSVDDVSHAASLEELGRLVKTLGYKVVGTMSQKRDAIDGGTVLGKGGLLNSRRSPAERASSDRWQSRRNRRPASALRTPTRRRRLPADRA